MKISKNFIQVEKDWESEKFTHFDALWFHCFESSVSAFLRKKLKSKEGISQWKLLGAGDITEPWIEENFMMLSLFSESFPFVVLDAQKVPDKILEKLLEALGTTDRKVFFFSESQLDKKKKEKLAQKDSLLFYEVKAPPFWDMDKLISSYFRWEGKSLTTEACDLIHSRLGPGFSEIENAFHICKINFPTQEQIGRDDLDSLFESQYYIHRFELANLFNEKKLLEFWGLLLKTEVDKEEWRLFFAFMISHVLKIIDPGYSGKKKKLSRYDRSILMAHKKWNTRQLDYMLKHFSEFILMIKQNKEIHHKLRELFLIFQKRTVS